MLQPTDDHRQRRKSRIAEIKDATDKGKQRSKSGQAHGSKQKSKLPIVGGLLRQQSSSSSSSGKADQSQIVDLVVEDGEAEQVERVRARKEGGPGWNETEAKHYV